MSTCAIQPLLSDGRCFGLSCLSRDSQRVAELELLRQIAGYTGTVQELLTAGKCFSSSCLSEDSQNVAELQLWCETLDGLTPTGCTPVTDARIYVASLFVDPFPVLWTVVGGTVSQDPMNGDVLATGSITSISVPIGIGCDGTFDLSLIGSCLESFTMDGAQVTGISLAGLPVLTFFGLSTTPTLLTFTAGSGAPLLGTLGLQLNTNLAVIDASGLANLTYLECSQDTLLTSLDITGCVLLATLNAVNCGLDQSSVDNALIELAANGVLNGTVNLSGGTSVTPSGAATTAILTLAGNGWTVTTN